MDKENDFVCFELNNWTCGKDYPCAEPFETWIGDDLTIYFLNEDWVKENKLCVFAAFIDMSLNFCITATKEWVETNCPNLLTEHKKFLRFKEDDEEEIYGRFGHEFLKYNEANIGITWEDENIDNLS